MRWTATLALAASVVGLGSAGRAAEFLGLGVSFSEALNISADGKTVVGGLYDNAARTNVLPFRWTKTTGLQLLPTDTEGVARGSAAGISSDSSIIVGYTGATDAFNDAVRWVDGGAPAALGDLAGGTDNSQAVDVSYDGSVIVGKSVSSTGVTAFRRTEAEGMVSLGVLTGANGRSEAYAVSGDGSTVVGSSSSKAANSGLFGEAFVWTEADGMQGLGHLHPEAAYVGSVAYDVSADGSVVVGVSSVLQIGGLVSTEAFRWTKESGIMQSLGDLPGDGLFSTAYGVSGDGSLVVGSGRDASGERAFIWDEADGMRNLRDVLVSDYGLGNSLTGWTLSSATAISADGMFLTGIGRNPDGLTESWYVDLNAKLIPGDANGDGKVDLSDFGILKSNFGSGTTLAEGDFNADGKVDLSDFGILKENFGATGAAFVPEPSSLVLAGIGVLALGLVARRRRTA
ncbi:MAG: dockerin type I domain-containing protein [Pirellulales bacterium]